MHLIASQMLCVFVPTIQLHFGAQISGLVLIVLHSIKKIVYLATHFPVEFFFSLECYHIIRTNNPKIGSLEVLVLIVFGLL